MKKLLVIVLLLQFALYPLGAIEPSNPSFTVSLTSRLDSLLKDTLLARSEVGLIVYDLTADTLLYSYQAEKLYRPASIQKIMTAVTALGHLGSDHSFNTTLYHTGDITPDSLLQGDLYIVGGFDPLINHLDIEAFAQAVVCQQMQIPFISVKYITDVIGQNSLKVWEDKLADARCGLSRFFETHFLCSK